MAKLLIIVVAFVFACSEADVSISAEILRHRRSDRKPEIIPYTPPYRCEISRYPGRRHQGPYLATHYAPSDSVCSLLCHLNDRTYSARGCMTANYIAATGLCEMIDYLAPYNVTRDSGSVKLFNWNCQPVQDGSTSPNPAPTLKTTTPIPEVTTTTLGPLPDPDPVSDMECTYYATPRSKYEGIHLKTETGIKSEEACALLCWQLRQTDPQRRWCSVANYVESQQKCELMKYNGNADVPQETTVNLWNIECKKTTPAPAHPPSPFPGTCGQTTVTQRRMAGFQRIVGGVEAKQHSLPFLVSLRTYTGFHFCGGSLIRVGNKDESDIVVTAAHCVNRDQTTKSWIVVAGAHYSTEQKVEGQQTEGVVKFVIHPNYNIPRRVANDIAILKLRRPIKFSKTIQPVCLPEKGEQVPEGMTGITAGWGRLKENGDASTVLMQVALPVVGTEKCKKTYPTLVEDAMMCAGFPQGGKDSCQGDSGGPYFFDRNNGYILQGVVSFGRGCGDPDTPGVYARVSNYVDWIQQQVRALTSVRD